MSTSKTEDQPAQEAIEDEHQDSLSDDSDECMQKSGVANDVNALMQGTLFKKGDTVHMSVVENGVRDMGIFKIHKGRYSESKATAVFQLWDEEKKAVHNKGKWYRDGVLKMERPA
ncbi:hypothetical protein IAQ61_010548 [Plenodomus lingam]|uniref:uncharacterized protein n=1 Tax=Leptosphaeria maculans TaxID=5022 RepID=UPI0033238406|nr:hypothetical protein IAQ61_010548 [Plenodomus lingam]